MDRWLYSLGKNTLCHIGNCSQFILSNPQLSCLVRKVSITFRNGRNESSLNRKHIRKYSDQQPHVVFFIIPIGFISDCSRLLFYLYR